MKPVMQKVGENANCTTACIASFLELDLNDSSIIDVYSFERNDQLFAWEKAFVSFFKEKGYLAIFDTIYYEDFVFDHRYDQEFQKRIEPIHFACGKTNRNPLVGHCVVYEKGKLLHDPHPKGKGLDAEEEYFIYFVRLN